MAKEKENLQTKIKALEELAKYFDSPDFDLDTGLEKYEAGMKLASEIKAQLKHYELKITEIQKRFNDEEE